MASAANNLGYPQTAEELIRAGWAYASVIDHRPLMAWLRLDASYASYRSGRLRQSRNLARSGLAYLDAGQNAAQLHLYRGLAAARLGDVDDARAAITAAHEARERGICRKSASSGRLTYGKGRSQTARAKLLKLGVLCSLASRSGRSSCTDSAPRLHASHGMHRSHWMTHPSDCTSDCTSGGAAHRVPGYIK
jgi:hypothetical protein